MKRLVWFVVLVALSTFANDAFANGPQAFQVRGFRTPVRSFVFRGQAVRANVVVPHAAFVAPRVRFVAPRAAFVVPQAQFYAPPAAFSFPSAGFSYGGGVSAFSSPSCGSLLLSY